MSRFIAVAGAVAVIVAAGAALSWGEGDSRVATKADGFSLRGAHAVDAPSAAAVARRASGPRIKYFETNSFAIAAGGREDAFLKCRRGHVAINGYWGSGGGVFADWFAVGENSKRRWEFGLANLTGAEAEAFLGIVCYRK